MAGGCDRGMLDSMRRTRTTTMTTPEALPTPDRTAPPPTGAAVRQPVIAVVPESPATARAPDPPAGTKSVPVRAHRFTPDGEYSIGVEEELMLVDARDLTLAAGVEPILRDLRDPRIKPELMQCQLELATSPCDGPADVLTELTTLRARTISAARAHGMRVAAVGTHPFSLA